MNPIYIKDIVEKASTSINAIEDHFGREPFTRKDYEGMLDRIVMHPHWNGKHSEHYTIESLIKHGIITVVRVETFSRVNVGRWDNFISNKNGEDIISKELWDMLSPHVRELIMETAEDNGVPIGDEAKRFYYAWTGVTAEDILEALTVKAKQELFSQLERARYYVRG